MGGRTYSVTASIGETEIVVDLGGQWIYQGGQKKIADLATELELPTTLQYHKGTKVSIQARFVNKIVDTRV